MTAGFVVRLIDAETLDDKGIYIMVQLVRSDSIFSCVQL
jgi:hypothetical protein